MSASDEPRLALPELLQVLRAADPAALLVPPRLLRRVIKHDRKIAGIGLHVPHRLSYVLPRENLLALVERAELEVPPDQDLPPAVLLLAAPGPEELAALPRGEALVQYWRLLFHARVHQAVADGRLSDAAVRRRVHQIGQVEFAEIRTVLRQESFLLPPGDDRTAYEEFAALYLELSFFAPLLLPRYFPTSESLGRLDRLLAEDVDGAALFEATRLAGSPDPEIQVDLPTRAEAPELEPTGATAVPDAPSDELYRKLLARAGRAAESTNAVRAAICLSRAAAVASPEVAEAVRARARAELNGLVGRLQRALHLDEAEAASWRQALPVLLPRAGRGIWPAEARLLYDLQKICVDHERPVYQPDLAEWAYNHFRGPLVRLLPDQPLVLTVRHLRGASHRLSSVRLTEVERHRLAALLHTALHHAEHRLRDRFRPVLGEALRHVGLEPQNFPEGLANSKIVEELLDGVTERGYLNLGNLRDALSRNQLKLPDLSGPGEWVTGDPLIRANRALAVAAPGVYRRGEVYLRWLQRGSALLFGTAVGRWLTLFLILPFGGAAATLVVVEELLKLARKITFWAGGGQPPDLDELDLDDLDDISEPARHPHEMNGTVFGVATLGLGILYLLLLHFPAFRRLVREGVRAAWHGARTVLVDLPAAVLRLPVVRRVLESRLVDALARFVLKPLPAAVLIWAGLWLCRLGPEVATAGAAGALLVVSLLLNTRLGWDLEERFTDWAVREWDYVRGLLPGLARLLMEAFKAILEAIDRGLYTVDEWLRFRSGESRLTLVVKTVLGSVWMVVTYAVRLYVNVFIEPTINPLKHFPAVTVAAKLLVPFWVPLTTLLATPFMFLGKPVALTIGFLNVHALAGAAGFLVWELKENWRLYRANRPQTLRPVVVGHHGETVVRLLRPGFHSGTLPKLYARLRRAERRAHRSGQWRSARRLRETLRHIEEGVGRFAERELLAFLNRSQGWAPGPVQLVTVEAGSNRIRLELGCPVAGGQSLELTFEEESGWLLAGISRPGWLGGLPTPSAAVLTTALTGYYKKAGVDLVREQIEASLPAPCPPYDIADEGLVVWPDGSYESEVAYDLGERPLLHPRVVVGQPLSELPVLVAEDVLFGIWPVTWQAWVEVWEGIQQGEGKRKPLLPGVQLLPAGATHSPDPVP